MIDFDSRTKFFIKSAPIITVTKNRFIKHYFIGSKRIASKIGTGWFSNVYGIGGNNITAGQKDYAARMMQIEKLREEYYKIIEEYKRFETLENYHAPEFSSNATEFHVTLWNLNYGVDVVKDNPHVIKEANNVLKDVVKETDDVVKGKANVTKEFAKAQRQIYKLISQMPQISAAQMSENMGVSLRQVQRYLKQLSDQKLIVREGGRKNGVWKILDDEYEGFFKRI